MIGSDTFIIVALRWIENSTPFGTHVGDLLGQEPAQCGHFHDCRVDDLAGEHRERNP